METSPRRLSIKQEEWIKGKLREKLLEILIELGFVSSQLQLLILKALDCQSGHELEHGVSEL